MFQRILLPLDGSPQAERVTPVAARLARHADSEVILLRVTDDGATDPAQGFVAWAPRHVDAAAYLTQVAGAEPLAGVRTQTIVREGDAVSGILSVAISSAADLIILSHVRHTDEPAHAPGNVAARVAGEAPMSVLLIREQQSPLARMRPTQPCALRLLVPLDGSPLAEAALATAAELLEALGAPERSSLHLAQIVANVSSWRSAARYLARIAESTRAGALTGRPINVSWSVIAHADPAEALLHLAEVGEDPDPQVSWSVARDLGIASDAVQDNVVGFQQCDAIVMTTHGRSDLHHLLLGSVAERILRAARMPLLLARHAPGAAPPHPLISEPDVERWRL